MPRRSPPRLCLAPTHPRAAPVRALGSAASALILIAGCDPSLGGGGGKRTPAGCTEAHGLITCSSTQSSGGQGLLNLEVDVRAGDTAFLVTGDAGQYLAVETLTGPSGELLVHWDDWFGSENLTAAFYGSGKDVAFNWPVREEDGALEPGTYTVAIATFDEDGYYRSGVDVDVTTQIKADGAFSEGVVRVQLVYADEVAVMADVVEATEAAIVRWKEVWAPLGLDVRVTSVNGGIDGNLPSVSRGGPEYDALASTGEDYDVMVVIGERIGGRTDIYGEAGGIPGSLVANEHAVVGVSWLANAGGDGSFSDDDIRIYGETLAHELGHYLGLFHPVESSWDQWDALDDTDDCGSLRQCEEALGENNMFPYPVCNGPRGGCVSQDVVTDGQAGVLHRYAGTL